VGGGDSNRVAVASALVPLRAQSPLAQPFGLYRCPCHCLAASRPLVAVDPSPWHRLESRL